MHDSSTDVNAPVAVLVLGCVSRRHGTGELSFGGELVDDEQAVATQLYDATTAG